MSRSSHHRHLITLLLVSCAVIGAMVGAPTGRVAAHNILVSSDPADGATLDSPPTSITWEFDNAVPLDTMTVTLVAASGSRTELAGSTHGTAGETQVITPLPTLEPGPVTLRWRLVGPDGHPITGRVEFTIEPDAATPAASTTTVAGSSTGSTSTTIAPDAAGAAEDDDVFTTPSTVRWVLRSASYLAIMAAVGILLVAAFVWPHAGAQPLLRRVMDRSLLATAVLGLVHLLVVASDVSGEPPWASFGSIDAATSTFAGMSFALRAVVAVALWIVLFRTRIVHRDVFWTAVSIPAIGLLATWAFAGHARSMRWPTIGVVTDVVHHAAAAAWIAGLAIVAWIAIPATEPDVMRSVVRNFSRVAAASVGVLVATGLVQSVRLVGGPDDLFDAHHGRYLVAKLAVLAAMLVFASANRRRVGAQLDGAEHAHDHVAAIRRGVATEFVLGVVIVGITAAMVVSPPATAAVAPTPAVNTAAVYYTL